MKLLVRLFASVCVLVAIQGCSVFTEQPSYETVQQQAPFELRDYDSVIVAETHVDATLEEAGDEAFERLFGYISGDNRVEEEELEADGQPIWARYNPPFTPWFLRHNEIMIPVKR